MLIGTITIVLGNFYGPDNNRSAPLDGWIGAWVFSGLRDSHPLYSLQLNLQNKLIHAESGIGARGASAMSVLV